MFDDKVIHTYIHTYVYSPLRYIDIKENKIQTDRQTDRQTDTAMSRIERSSTFTDCSELCKYIKKSTG